VLRQKDDPPAVVFTTALRVGARPEKRYSTPVLGRLPGAWTIDSRPGRNSTGGHRATRARIVRATRRVRVSYTPVGAARSPRQTSGELEARAPGLRIWLTAEPNNVGSMPKGAAFYAFSNSILKPEGTAADLPLTLPTYKVRASNCRPWPVP
jgi:hypothetical protein